MRSRAAAGWMAHHLRGGLAGVPALGLEGCLQQPSPPFIGQVASWLGEEALRQQMEQADPTAAELLQQLLAGQPLGGGAGSGPSSSA